MRGAPRHLLLALFVCAAGASCAETPAAVTPPPPTAMTPPPAPTATEAPAPAAPKNPFLEASTLLYQAPPFDRIHDGDYEPAIDAGMAEQLAEVARITSQEGPPTFDDTIVALERSGELLTRVLKVFSAMTGANTNDALQKIEQSVSPKLAAHQDAIYLNAKLYARVKALYEHREGMDAESRYLTERYRRDFVHAGAELARRGQDAARGAQQGGVVAEHRLLAEAARGHQGGRARRRPRGRARRASAPGDVAAAAQAAKRAQARRASGSSPLQNTTQQPAQADARGPRHARAPLQGLHRARRARRRATTRAPSCGAWRSSARARPSSSATRPGRRTCSRTRWRRRPPRPSSCSPTWRPAAVAKAREEAERMQTLADKEKRGLPLAAVGLAVLRRAGPQGGLRARRRADQALLRARPRAPRRRVLRGEQALRAHLQGAPRPARLPARRARVRGVRRRRQVVRALLRGLLQARQQERRRLDGRLRRPVGPARHAPGHLQRLQLHQAGAGAARAPQLRRRDDDVPRVRPRAARPARRT